MNDKKARLKVIVDLISQNSVSSQEGLVNILASKGFDVTQATVSRDLRALRVSKMPLEKGEGYRYILPNNPAESLSYVDSFMDSGKQTASQNVLSLDFSGNIAVIKTRNGYASGLAYDIDMSRVPEVLGTISGADTVFALLREDLSREQAAAVLQKFFEN